MKYTCRLVFVTCLDINIVIDRIDHLTASLTPPLRLSLCVSSPGKFAPGSLQGNNIDPVGVVATVRGQAGHPIHGCYRVSCYGTEAEGRSGTHTHTLVCRWVIYSSFNILSGVCMRSEVWSSALSELHKSVNNLCAFDAKVQQAAKTHCTMSYWR